MTTHRRARQGREFVDYGIQEETVDNLEGVKRENKNLAEEIAELQTNIGGTGRSLHDLKKAKQSVKQERCEQQGSLEEAEAAFESLRVLVELQQLRKKADSRIDEKDEEIDNARRNALRSVEKNQASLDVERPVTESDFNDLMVQLEIDSVAHEEHRCHQPEAQHRVRVERCQERGRGGYQRGAQWSLTANPYKMLAVFAP